jgi:ADP-ribose pyrophosphatase
MAQAIEREIAHRGPLFAVEVLKWQDASGRTVRRDVVRHPGAVLIVPELDGDRVVLVRNVRVAVDTRLWELPAGTLEPPEPPEQAAARELTEETGYKAGRIEPLGRFYTTPGMTDELMHVYVASDLVEVGQRLEPGEDIEVGILDAAAALAMIDDGTIRDGKTIAGLLMWQRRRLAADGGAT